MAKWVNSAVLDAALNIIRNSNAISVTNTQPTTRTEAATTFKLAATTASISALQAGDAGTSARKITINPHTSVTVDASGTAQHVALYDASTLYYITTCTSQYLTSGNTVTVPTWKIEFDNPTP
jgi:hypothetical protein